MDTLHEYSMYYGIKFTLTSSYRFRDPDGDQGRDSVTSNMSKHRELDENMYLVITDSEVQHHVSGV